METERYVLSSPILTPMLTSARTVLVTKRVQMERGTRIQGKTCNARWETLIMQGKKEQENKKYNARFVCFRCIVLSYTANER